MRFCLISASEELREACEAAAEGGPPVELVVTSDSGRAGEGDVVLWDVTPPSLPPSDLIAAGGRQHLVAVDAAAADTFRHWKPCVPVLLKPVKPEVLRPFIIAAAQRRRTPSNGGSERRTSFLARAARELRGPLAALNGYCTLLLDRNVGGSLNATQSDVVERMHDSVRHAARIAEGLCSATTAPDDSDKTDRAGIEECIRSAMADARIVIQSRQITIELLVEQFAGQTFFAPARLRYAVAGLVEYACVNSPRSATVWISAYPVVRHKDGTSGRAGDGAHPDAYRVDIRDSGRAMSIDELNALFDETGDSQPALPRIGSFALAITKKIIAGFGGTIFPDSTATGVTISVLVPWRASTASPVQFHRRQDTALEPHGIGGRQ